MSELIQFDGRTVTVIAPEDLESLEQDAARYRWLRDSQHAPQTYGELYGTDQLDAAIDAAMKGKA